MNLCLVQKGFIEFAKDRPRLNLNANRARLNRLLNHFTAVKIIIIIVD